MSIAKLKKNRNKRLKELKNKAENAGKKYSKDDRYWFLEKEKSTGVGKAIIRFIPDPNDVYEVPFFSHTFQHPTTNRWLIETCPTTHYGEYEFDKCPVCQESSRLYNLPDEEGRPMSKKIKRDKKFVSNIYVVKDYANPENNGKVFLYKYGVKIHEKIVGMIENEFEDEDSVNVFDLWEGKDFLLKSKTTGSGNNKWISYDDSQFSANNCFEDLEDEEIEAIWTTGHDIRELQSLENIKSYDKLQERLDHVMGDSTVAPTSNSEPPADDEEEEELDLLGESEEETEEETVKESSKEEDEDFDMDNLEDELDSLLDDLEDD